MKDINSNRDSKNPLIELSLINSINDEEEDNESTSTKVNRVKSRNNTSKILATLESKITSENEDEEDDKNETWNLIPENFFSFNLIFYILIFLLLFLPSFNFSYLSIPYTFITILLCLLSNISKTNKCYYALYILRILLFPFICIISFGLIIYKIYIFSKIFDDDNDTYALNHKDNILNMGIFYVTVDKSLFSTIRSIGPEIIIFIYTLFFSIILLLAETKCLSEYPICFDIEKKYGEKTTQIIRRSITVSYILLLFYAYFNPSFSSFTYIAIHQICLGVMSNNKRDYINKRYCVIKFFIILCYFIFAIQLGLNNILQINKFQLKYLINKSEKYKDSLTCEDAKNIWNNLGINCVYNVGNKEKIFIGYAFGILSFISVDNLIRILANGSLVTHDEYYREKEEKVFVQESEEISWIVRKIENLLILIINFIENPNIICHLCRILAIIHINYCQNVYSLVVFLWLFLSFICNQVKSTKNFCIFCVVPVLIISSLCYNLSNFDIFDDDDEEEEEKDIYTFLGLKKLNKYFYISFISCHVFFLLIIAFVSSLEKDSMEFSPIYSLTSVKTIKDEEKENTSGVLKDISLLSVNSLISIKTTRKRTLKKKVKNIEEKKFENKFKNLLQKKINLKSNEEDNKNKNDENIKILHILEKKFFMNLNKINLILVYLVSVSSINVVHLLLVLIFVINVISTIIASRIKKNKKDKDIDDESEMKMQYYVTKITLIIIQISFLIEFCIDLYKCFYVNSKSEEDQKKITDIMKFILNYKEDINDSSCETLLFIIAYCYYFEYQIYVIKNKKSKHKDLENLLNNRNISYYCYFKTHLKYTFFIYDYFMKFLSHFLIWIYTFIFIFFLCHFELNILFSIQLLLFLISIYLLLRKIQENININNNSLNKKVQNIKDIIITYIFLIFSVINTIIVYLYQFICHDYWYNKIKDTFLLNENLSYIGLKKYSGDLYIKLLPFFVINFISTLFLNELDSFQKRLEREAKSLKDSSNNNNIRNSIKEIEKENLDYIELYEKCKKDIFNIQVKLFGINIILIITKIYWILLFFIICSLFNSYYFSLSIAIYIMIFAITFIKMFNEILKTRNSYNYIINSNINDNKIISEESIEIINRMKINRNHREIAFRVLVAYSFLIFFLYYIYGIFDISISYCNPKIWKGCDNKDNIIKEDSSNDDSDTIGIIKSISFIFGVYYNTKKDDVLSVGWVHLFLCFLFCFDVYIQKIANYFNNLKTQKITEKDEKSLELIWLRQKSLESQVDSLIHPNKENEKNKKQVEEISGSLRQEIGKKIIEDLANAIKMFNLYKINQKRNKQIKKIMLSFKYILEEIIILFLIIASIEKINIWSIIYFLFLFFLIFTSKSVKKFFYFYCFDIIGIILQIILFVGNIQESIVPRKPDDEIFNLIHKYLKIPWFKSKDYLVICFIFGIGVDKNQTNTIYYDYLLIAITYIYLENFTYNAYNETDSINRLIIPFIKGNILYDSMIDNPALKNGEIDISKKDFYEIKRVVKKNTFIETVNAIRYDDFLIALKKLKIFKKKPNKIEQEIKIDDSKRQKMLKKLNAKTQEIFNLFEFIKIILYLSSHNFVLIINILICMMIPGIISLIYIIIFIGFLFKSNSLIQGKRYYYPHFTKNLRLIILIDITVQLVVQFFIGDGLISKICNNIGINKLLEFKNGIVIKDDESFTLIIAKTFSYFFISLQILIYSSVDYIEYYFIYLLTLKVNQYKTSKINAFKFNNERIDVMTKSLTLKEEAYKTMDELQFLLEDWRNIFSKGKKKLSLKRSTNFKIIEEDKISKYVKEKEAKKTIKEWIMDKFLIKLYTYIHKYSSPYQNLGDNEVYELEKNIIQGETRPITYIEYLIDFYLEALSPFKLTEQDLSIVESILNGSRDEKRQEIKKIKEKNKSDQEKKIKENENMKKQYEELVGNVEYIDSVIEGLKDQIENEKENVKKQTINELERKDTGHLTFALQNLIQTKPEKKRQKNEEKIEESKEEKENKKEEEEEISSEDEKERNDSLIDIPGKNLSPEEKASLLSNYEKAKKIILEEEEKIKKKIKKYEIQCEREEKHNKNKYLDDEIESDGFKKEINKIDLTDPKFMKFEILRKKSILFERYLKNSFIFSCILLDLKSCLSYNFHWFCYILMIINHMHSASLISVFYPLTIFCYAIIEHPRPSKTYWKICLVYTFAILFLKLLFTLKIFTIFIDEDTFIEFLDNLHIYKIGFKYCKSTFGRDFLSYIICDILVIISLMININILVINGTWKKREQEIESIYSAMERISISNCNEINDEEIKDFNKEFLSSGGLAGNKNLENLSKDIDENKAGKHRRRGRVSFMEDFKINQNLNLKDKYKKEEKDKNKDKDDEENDNQENKEMKKNYFQRLFPKNRNEKPGAEYYPMYTGAMILILAYILIFFNNMIRDESYGEFSLDVQQFNGLMVIYFILHVIILLCDRAILLFQNQKNMRYKYFLYHKKDFSNLKNIIDFRKKTKEDKSEYFRNNLNIVEDNLIELFPKKKRWQNHNLIIPIQYLPTLRNNYYISYRQIESFNKPLFCKYLLYISIVLFVHYVTFIYFPMAGNINLGNEIFCTERGKCNDFNSNNSLIFFYLFYILYFIPSALQIKYGFQEMKKKSILRRNHTEFNNLLVTIFLQIPFLNEVKNIFDWTLTSTSLDLSQWIQFESIYEAIFSTYSDDRDEENVIGQKIEKSRKAKKGGVLSFILITALIFPLVIFSSLNPTNITNSVYDAKLKVDLSFTYNDKETKKYTLFENNRPETITDVSDDVFKEFNYSKSVRTRNFPKGQVQTVKFYETSDTNWDLVLPHIKSIVNELNITNPDNKINTIELIIQTQFTRPLPAEAQIVTDEIKAEIFNINNNVSNPENTKKALILSNALTNCQDSYINFFDIYSPPRRLSSSTSPIVIEDYKHFSNLGLQLGFMGCDNSTGKINFLQSYFTLKSIKKSSNSTNLITEPFSFHIFSETISPTTSSYSVYAFYTAVILVFGEYVRDFCSGEPEKVTLNEMPDPKKMVDLCEGITIARSSHDFRMEKKLYFILIELLREPTYLKEITKSSVERFEEREEVAKYITTDDID